MTDGRTADTASGSARERVYLQLVSDYQSAILNYLHRLVPDRAVAEDLTQETFLRAYRALPRLELGEGAESRRRGWLYRIAHNLAADHHRRRSRLTWLSLDGLRGQGGPDATSGFAEGAPVRQALARLSADQRSVLILFSIEEMSAQEVAEILGIEPAAARKRRQRARAAFIDAYRDITAADAGKARQTPAQEADPKPDRPAGERSGLA